MSVVSSDPSAGALYLYMDHHASTPCAPEVVAAMLPWFAESCGNASSTIHRAGREAHSVVERARRQVAARIGASPKEIIFTSGATEATHLALYGLAAAAPTAPAPATGRRHILVSAAEHKVVIDTATSLQRQGFSVSFAPVLADGSVDVDAVIDRVREDTLVVCCMMANNEVGAISPIAALGPRVRERGALLFCDAVQAAAFEPMEAVTAACDLMTLSGHKAYGPKGVGALVVRRRRPAVPLGQVFFGGSQERGLRPGTLNVPGIVGMGAAFELAEGRRVADRARISALRLRLWRGLEALGGVRLNGPAIGQGEDGRLAHNLHISVDGVEARRLLDGVGERLCVSSSSACTTTDNTPSHVLAAMGVSNKDAYTAIRFGLGRGNDAAQVDAAIGIIADALRRLRP